MDVIRTVAICGLFSISGSAISGTIIEVERFNDDGERDSTITIALQDGQLPMGKVGRGAETPLAPLRGHAVRRWKYPAPPRRSTVASELPKEKETDAPKSH